MWKSPFDDEVTIIEYALFQGLPGSTLDTLLPTLRKPFQNSMTMVSPQIKNLGYVKQGRVFTGSYTSSWVSKSTWCSWSSKHFGLLSLRIGICNGKSTDIRGAPLIGAWQIVPFFNIHSVQELTPRIACFEKLVKKMVK